MPQSTVRLSAEVSQFPVSMLDGPGERWVLWTQGCRRAPCPGCINPHLLDPAGGVDTSISTMVREFASVRERYPDLEGVTLSGGEPFDQAEALAEFARAVRKGGLTVMVFTGWLLENLLSIRPPGAEALLEETDILIDGPFIQERCRESLKWRGSDNQRILLLSDAYNEDQLSGRFAPNGIDVAVYGDSVHMSGARDRRVLENVLRRLRSSGFRLSCPPD